MRSEERVDGRGGVASRICTRIWLIVSLYNWVLPHQSLRQGRQRRTPAMALGLTDHVWSYTEYIWHHISLCETSPAGLARPPRWGLYLTDDANTVPKIA